MGASTTLSGMIRCSPAQLREDVINALNPRFTQMLSNTAAPKSKQRRLAASTNETASGRSTPNSAEQNAAIIKRHAAVLGLGALVQAFPYTSPPPAWVPGVLTTLATRATGDPGVAGKSAKSIVSDFKKTRQDTWHIDVKVRALCVSRQ